jgi:membrane peptidoglycan carboxypeptidase
MSPAKHGWLKLIITFIGTIGIFTGTYVILVYQFYDPASIDFLSQSTQIYDQNGVLQQTIYEGETIRHFPIPLSQIPQNCQEGLIAIEDKSFYYNIGIDVKGMVRGTLAELTGQSFGGSTITQQLVKLGTQDIYNRNILEKLDESIYALKLTASMSKTQILEKYLNTVYFGNYNYGMEAASTQYFGKSASELDLAQCAYLAGLPNEPSVLNPYADPSAGIARQHLVLAAMRSENYITEEEYQSALSEELTFSPSQ